MAGWLKTDGMTGRQMLDLPPVWLLGFIGLVWLQVWLWPDARLHLGLLSAVGALLFWGGIALMIWAIWTFRTHQTSVIPHQMPQQIITTGPFRYSRNPIYLGDLMILAGVVLGKGAWPCLVLIPLLAVILKRRFIAQEEDRMKQNFGAEFADYAKKTSRWL